MGTTTVTMMMGTTVMGMTSQHRRASFRMRVLGSLIALLAVAGVAGLLIQRAVLLRGLDEQVTSSLEQEREELQSLAQGRNPLTGEPFGRDVAAIFDTFLARNVPAEGEVYITFVDGEPYKTTPAPLRLDVVPELVARWSKMTVGEGGEFDTAAGPVRFVAVPLQIEGVTSGVFVAANFVGAARTEIETDIRLEGLITGLVLAVVAIFAWFVAGRLLRPVAELTETAETISESDLTRRIPVEGDDELARLALTFNEMLDRLEAAFVSQRTFIDDAGHELRTPITIIRGHLEVMGVDPEDRRQTLDLVFDELDRMSRIVDDLLILAKAEQPDFLRLEPVELADLTTELVVKSRPVVDRSWKLDACAEGSIDADPQRLTQAVLNLIRNAVEHTTTGAEIGIGSAWEGAEARIWVRDTGPGVEESEKERIFERFARGRGGRRSEGAGLGLSIVDTIAKAHGGRVELDSPPGGGATFSIFVPGSAPIPGDDDLGARDNEPKSEEVVTWPGS
jgi:signal transduction histidine kinase